MSYTAARAKTRSPAALATLLVHAGIALLLIRGLGGAALPIRQTLIEAVNVVALPPAPPPPAARAPRKAIAPRREGASAPANIRSRAAPVEAPPAVMPPPLPQPRTAAPVAATGPDPSSGASDRPGPGTGAGGAGNGTGSGGAGDGDGGGDGGDETPPRLRSGRIRNSDFPSQAWEAGIGGTVEVRYDVGVDGRVSHCAIERSSGSRLLDVTTCRLIEQRFRFTPSRDVRGRPVVSTIIESHEWVVERDTVER